MEIRKLENDYQFVNEFLSTRNGFAHKSTLFKGNYEIESHKVNYLNRTWECYTYQTSMIGCINKVIEQLQDKAISNYKYNNNIKRLSSDTKKNILADLEQTEKMIQYRQIREELKARY